MAKEPVRQTIRRPSDEPKLRIGDRISLKEGVGVVLARYTSRGGRNEICYVVDVISDQREKAENAKA